jgi:hypothetical protein
MVSSYLLGGLEVLFCPAAGSSLDIAKTEREKKKYKMHKQLQTTPENNRKLQRTHTL